MDLGFGTWFSQHVLDLGSLKLFWILDFPLCFGAWISHPVLELGSLSMYIFKPAYPGTFKSLLIIGFIIYLNVFFIWHWHYKHYKVFFCYDDMRIPTLRGQRNLTWIYKMLLLLHHVSPNQLRLHEQDHAVYSVTGRLGSDELPHTVFDGGPRRLSTSSG